MSVRDFWDKECPRCRQDDQLQVRVDVWCNLTQGGTDEEVDDHTWHKHSMMRCASCGYVGEVKEFDTETPVTAQ